MNWTKLNWSATSRPNYTTRQRSIYTTWLAQSELGRLVLSQFVGWVNTPIGIQAFRTPVRELYFSSVHELRTKVTTVNSTSSKQCSRFCSLDCTSSATDLMSAMLFSGSYSLSLSSSSDTASSTAFTVEWLNLRPVINLSQGMIQTFTRCDFYY